MLWTNGGPGASSALGLFMEHGPCLVNENETETRWNPFSWNERANMIYIDQPIGEYVHLESSTYKIIGTDTSQESDSATQTPAKIYTQPKKQHGTSQRSYLSSSMRFHV